MLHKKQSTTKKQSNSEDGFAAIIVAMIIMSIIVLITIGFVRIVGREQRAALDRQLSTQAFYAAETGVNDAARQLNDDSFLDLLADTNNRKDDCDVDGAGWSPVLDASVEYTCVLIDTSPTSLEYDSVAQDSPKVLLLKGVNDEGASVSIDEIDIYWQSDPYPESPLLTPGGNFPRNTDADNFGNAAPVLRISLTPLDGSLSRQILVENTMTFFLRPTSDSVGAPARDFIAGSNDVADQGQVFPVECNINSSEPRICKQTINMSSVGNSDYLMTVRSVYSDSSLFIRGDSSDISDPNEELRFAEQQAIVDATGRASDVLRRIQVRLPLENTYRWPGFALEGNICKQYSIYPGEGDNDGDAICAITNN